MSWLGQIFGRTQRVGEGARAAVIRDDADRPGNPGEKFLAELADSVPKLARAQARQGARLEEIEGKVEAGFADLRAAISTASSAQDLRWDELLDGMDLLEQAAGLSVAIPELERGLRGVSTKLERFAAQAGIERRSATGAAPDGRLFRVVGIEDSPAFADGAVAKVVRAAVLRGGRLLREGEVIVNRRTA